MQRQPSLGGGDDNRNNQAADYNYSQQSRVEHERIEKTPVINYGATESNNPFHSSNPFATDVSATLVQPPARDDYAHDVVQDQQWK